MLSYEELGSPEEIQKTLRDMRSGVITMDREKEIWTADEQQRLIELFQEGIGVSELAVRLRRSERAISKRIEQLRLYGQKRPRRECTKQLKGCLCPNCSIQNDCAYRNEESADIKPALHGKG